MTVFKSWLRTVIEITIANHPKDCIFGPDPVDGAMQWLEDHGPFLLKPNQRLSDSLLDRLIEAIQLQEIYCPHEGIDRRQDVNASSFH